MPKILFVCTANQCRSPMAEVLFRRKLAQAGIEPDWTVSSAGAWAMEAEPATADAQQVAAEHGLDLSQHRSRSVEALDLDGFDLILVMTAGHLEALRTEFPEVGDRVERLAAMAGPPYDVADPVGAGLEAYRETWAELERLIDQGFDAIRARVA